MHWTYFPLNYPLNTFCMFFKIYDNQYFERYGFLELLPLSISIFLGKKRPLLSLAQRKRLLQTPEFPWDLEEEQSDYPHPMDSAASRNPFSLIYWNWLNKFSSGEQESIILMPVEAVIGFTWWKTSTGNGDGKWGPCPTHNCSTMYAVVFLISTLDFK